MSERAGFILVVALPMVAMLVGHSLVFFLEWRRGRKRRSEVL